MAVIKWYLQVLAVCSIALVGIDGAKSKDEGRPYEFGFTIDGQQHRHERKDANGIIQGEFGFITADGVYHVTTYATDENGAFRILSMRNIKISGPLDGTKAGEYKTKPLPIGQAATQTAQNPKPQQQATQENHPEKIQQSPVVNQVQVQATTRKPLVFTTQPTIKPACAGCGYVTRAPTTKKPIESTEIANIQHFDSGLTKPVSFVAQNKGTQHFNDQQGNNGIVSHQNIQNYPNSVHNNIGDKPYEQNNQVGVPNTSISPQNLPGNTPQIPNTNQFSSNIPNTSAFVENSPYSNVGNQNLNQNNPKPTPPNQNFVGNYPSSSPYIDSNQNSNVDNQNINQYDPKPAQPNLNNQNVAGDFPTNKPNDFPVKNPDSNQNSNVGNQNINQYDPKPAQPNLNNQNVAGGFPTNKPNDFPVKNPSHSIVDDIKIDNNAIIVPNNPPIPIKDKYPGMVDGLPEGISQTDISDILYKFNYTIGFHGHYEKGLRNGTKIGGYFVNGRDGISRVVTYVADERGFRPKFKLVNLGLDSPLTPKEETEKTFGLQSFEFVWYPLK